MAWLRDHGGWDGVAEFLAFVLGPLLFALLVVGGLLAVLISSGDLKLSLAEYLGAVGAGAGLLTVGHGLHRVARSRERTSEQNPPT